MEHPNMQALTPQKPKDEMERRINFFMERADGGAILVGMNMHDPSDKRTAIVSGSPDTAAFQRKAQRTFIRWVKEFFPAPARAGSAAEAEQLAAAAQAASEAEENTEALPRAD